VFNIFQDTKIDIKPLPKKFKHMQFESTNDAKLSAVNLSI